MSLIFIAEFKRTDRDAFRDLKTKSKNTVGRKHLYSCKKLNSWFRIGRFVVKHNIANYLVGVSDYAESYHEREDVRWSEYNEDTKHFENKTQIEIIANEINKHFKGNEYIETLLRLQEEMKGYEACYYWLSNIPNFRFDYKKFLEGKDAYLEYAREEYKKYIEK